MRPMLRIDSAEPTLPKSITDKEDARRDIPPIDIAAPKRDKARSAKEDPK
jgi:hypothetical protein